MMIWNGKELNTIGELNDAVCSVQTEEEAARFMEQYRKENEAADANVGYVIGYNGGETRERLYGLFKVNHPMFGTPV